MGEKANELAHSERAHSLLSPSGASRWMSCTPSARKEEFLPNYESPYAKEGTLAHELGETELKKYFGLISEEEYKQRINQIESDDLYSDEMPEEVGKYVDHIIEQYLFYKASCSVLEISIEEKIDLTKYIEDGFGSNDFIMVTDNVLEVIDLKYGRGVSVSAVDNSQLKLYGLGALYKHELTYDIKEVKLTIVQPRTNNISSFVISAEDLINWGETEVKTKAEIAFKGEGEFNSGEWCKFCKFKPMCKKVMEDNLKTIKEDFADPHSLTEDEILEVYNRKEQIVSWLNSVEAHMLNKLMNKENVKGFKLVEGRSTRKIKDTEAVKSILLDNKFDNGDIMQEPKLLGITALEKLLGKAKFSELLGEQIFKDKGKPTIATVDDKRNDFFSSAAEDFI